MPADMTFDSQGVPSCKTKNKRKKERKQLFLVVCLTLFKNTDVNAAGDVRIGKDDKVRVRIVGTRVDTNEIVSSKSLLIVLH
jgi:hypothetical protein